MDRKYLYSSLLCPRLYKNCAIIMLSSSRVPRSTVIRCPGESAAAVGALQGPPGSRPVRAHRTSLSRGPPVRTSSRTRPSSHASAAVRVRASCCLPRFALGRSGRDSLSSTPLRCVPDKESPPATPRYGFAVVYVGPRRSGDFNDSAALRHSSPLRRPDHHAATVVEVVRELERWYKRRSDRSLSA